VKRSFRVLLGWPEESLPPGAWLGDGGGGRPLVLAHAGPDGRGLAVATNEKRTVHVVMAGTVHNRRDLRASLEQRHSIATRDDAELVAHLYEERGPGALAALRGAFALAIYDDRNRRLLLARDQLGIIPLYWTSDRGRFAAAPEMALLATLRGVASVADPAALDTALMLGCVPPPATLLPGIRQLWPGECVLFEDGRPRSQRYWQPVFPERRRSITDLPRMLRGQLSESLRLAHGAAEEAPSLLLTGGFASAALLALGAEDGRTPARTYTVTADGEPDAEARAAARLAARAGVEHCVLGGPEAWEVAVHEMLTGVGAPIGSPEDVVMRVAVTRAAAERGVVIGGIGAGEILGGSMPALAMARADAYRQLPSLVREGAELAIRVLPKKRLRALRHMVNDARLAPSEMYARAVSRFSVDLRQELYTEEAFNAVFDARPWEVFTRLFADATSAGATDPADAIHYTELVLRLPARIAALTAGVDADIRLPFVDHRLAQFVTGLLPPERTDRRFGCPALREALRGLLPDAVCHAGHLNSLRAAVWASPAFRTYCRETLSPERLTAQGVFRPDAVARLWAEHEAGRVDHGARLWSLVLATRWLTHPEIQLGLERESTTIVSHNGVHPQPTGSTG
jgi:asparagine synthase (glutamine-hydrolysing)